MVILALKQYLKSTYYTTQTQLKPEENTDGIKPS